MILVGGQADLLQVIGAFKLEGGVPDFLNRWNHQGDQHCNDGQHDKQFDKRERSTD